MNGKFDFRDMLGGASATVADEAAVASMAVAVAHGRTLVSALGTLCVAQPIPPHLVIGFVLAEVAASYRIGAGDAAAGECIRAWRELLDRLEKPGGLDRG